MNPVAKSFDDMIDTVVVEWTPPPPQMNATILHELHEAEIYLLKAVNKNLDDFATAHYSAAGLCAHSGVKAQEGLIKKGYLIPRRIDTGRRGAKPLLLTLTTKAKDFLRSIGESVKMKIDGRGAGEAHQFHNLQDSQLLQESWLSSL